MKPWHLTGLTTKPLIGSYPKWQTTAMWKCMKISSQALLHHRQRPRNLHQLSLHLCICHITSLHMKEGKNALKMNIQRAHQACFLTSWGSIYFPLFLVFCRMNQICCLKRTSSHTFFSNNSCIFFCKSQMRSVPQSQPLCWIRAFSLFLYERLEGSRRTGQKDVYYCQNSACMSRLTSGRVFIKGVQACSRESCGAIRDITYCLDDFWLALVLLLIWVWNFSGFSYY